MSRLLALLTAAFVFGNFAIPWAVAQDLALWYVVAVIGGGVLARTITLEAIGLAISGRLERRATDKGRPYPPLSVTRMLDVAEKRGARRAGLIAPFVTGNFTGIFLAAIPAQRRGDFIPWVILGTMLKVLAFTVVWALAIRLGFVLAEQISLR